MALIWEWENQIGTAYFRDSTGDYEAKLYQGNAMLIMIVENEDRYSVAGFFADKEHAKRCLGLERSIEGCDNIYNRDYCRLYRIKINKKKYRYTKELVTLLIKAFPAIEIEVFSNDD